MEYYFNFFDKLFFMILILIVSQLNIQNKLATENIPGRLTVNNNH